MSGRTGRRLGPVDIAFIAAFGVISAVQLAALAVGSPGLDRAAGIARVIVLPVAMLCLGYAAMRRRGDRPDQP